LRLVQTAPESLTQNASYCAISLPLILQAGQAEGEPLAMEFHLTFVLHSQ